MKTRLFLLAWVVGCAAEPEVDREAEALERLIQALGLDVLAARLDGLGRAPAGPDGLSPPGFEERSAPDGVAPNRADGQQPEGLGQGSAGEVGLGGGGDPTPSGASCADICPRVIQCLAEQNVELEPDECIDGCNDELADAGARGLGVLECLASATTCGGIAVCLRLLEEDENEDPPPSANGRAPRPVN